MYAKPITFHDLDMWRTMQDLVDGKRFRWADRVRSGGEGVGREVDMRLSLRKAAAVSACKDKQSEFSSYGVACFGLWHSSDNDVLPKIGSWGSAYSVLCGDTLLTISKSESNLAPLAELCKMSLAE